ncbi:MAG TPA: hypothetical protein VIL46_14530 [Gemmataceae bacterium]
MSLSNRSLFVTLAAATLLSHVVSLRAQDNPAQWSVYSTDHYQLLYHPANEADARKVKGFLDAGVASLKKEFAEFPVDDLLRVNCRIFLHPGRTDRASEYQATITTGRENGKYYAVIDLLTPSAYGPNYRSNVNEPAGDDYFSKLVMHEYSTILLEQLTRSKKAGWTYFSAPRWWVDGYEEYLALMHSTPRNRNEVLRKYLAVHKGDPDRIAFDYGIGVKDDYIDGALLLLFMHETFGKEKVHAVLASEAPWFGKAMASALGVGLDEFKKRWDEWLKQKLRS